MAKTTDQELRRLRAEVAELRSSLEALRGGAVSKEVKVVVNGPRRAGILIESQAIELPGEGRQSGKRVIDLERPRITVVLGVKARAGTKVTLELEINGKTKKEPFWMEIEKEEHRFEYDFADFGL